MSIQASFETDFNQHYRSSCPSEITGLVIACCTYSDSDVVMSAWNRVATLGVKTSDHTEGIRYECWKWRWKQQIKPQHAERVAGVVSQPREPQAKGCCWHCQQPQQGDLAVSRRVVIMNLYESVAVISWLPIDQQINYRIPHWFDIPPTRKNH